jgi:oxygen-independent coproporphyrinogen III oxidase
MVDSHGRPVRSLYIHVPFCAHKCEYCAFYSEAAQGELVNRFTAALIRELELVAGQLQPATIFFGGGTPSLLNLRQWEQILSTMHRLGLAGAAEWTVECNPATVSLDKARLLREAGVNRISMGVQSLDERLLERLGRIHSREQVFKSYDTLRAAGFENVNIDLMFAIPGQSMEVWQRTLDEALALGTGHLSCYEVIYEEDTPLFQQLQAGEFDVDEDLACDMYEALRDRAAAAGFVHYEVANFARLQRAAGILPAGTDSSQAVLKSGGVMDGTDGGTPAAHLPALACRHNVNYWRGGPYHGLGPSAAGFVKGVRTKNWSNTQLYCEQLEKGRRAIESRDELPPPGWACA